MVAVKERLQRSKKKKKALSSVGAGRVVWSNPFLSCGVIFPFFFSVSLAAFCIW